MTDGRAGAGRISGRRVVLWSRARLPRPLAGLLAAALVGQALAPAGALAQVAPGDLRGPALAGVIERIAADYPSAAKGHDAAAAARLRSLAAVVASSPATGSSPGAAAAAERLAGALAPTRVELGPWPPPLAVRTLAGAAIASLHAAARSIPAKPYTMIESRLRAAAAGGPGAGLDLATAYVAYADQLAPRLAGVDPTLADQLAGDFFAGRPARAAAAARGDLEVARQALGDVTIGHATIVADAAVIVFREGLEAVLILAAITASFTGDRARLRRPVLLGGIAGLGATGLTWLVVGAIVDAFGGSGLKLQAVTGVIAIVVLLVVTNWFFHRIYWSQWISRFNRRRKSLEAVGFVSGQVVGMVVLGLTSVYREGFETVLFLQSLQVSAGTGATLLGAGIGLGGTAAVGILTFVVQRKLPYKKMLIGTGVMIAVVLSVMVGTTAHTFEQLGWLPTHQTAFALPIWCNRWLGLYATWEGIAAQVSALVFVIGSYFLARQVQARHRRSRVSATGVAQPSAGP
jgi:FTR1 family protein